MKTGRKVFLIVLLISLFAFSVFAAGGKGEAAAGAPQFTVYAVVHGGIADPYWKMVEKGMKDAAALVPELKLIYTGPDAFAFEQFMAMLEAAIAAQPDGLIATMTNPPAMDDLLRRAISGGLPVIAVDSPDSRPTVEKIPYLSYVGEIPYEGGVLAAKEVLKDYKPKRAFYGNHQPGALNLVERGQGFIDIMQAAGVPVEAVDTTEDVVQAAEIMLAYVKAHPDTDTIFTGNMVRAEALVVRLEEEGIKPGQDVKISTFGLTTATMEMMEQGKIDFSIDEQPYMQGFLGVTFMFLHLKYGFTPPAEIPTLGLFPDDVSALKELIDQGIR
ncbi:MAG: substrate-binding domain-containing protein [Spirochaetaceae bacterium]|nr:MAG: substrate-binding domain-containing protein [Spirochaetaceae bacterium]